MTIRIGLVSDVHSSPVPLRQALEIFAAEKVDEIICAGDIAGYYDMVAPTVALLRQSNCRAVVGNHDQSYLQQPPENSDPEVRAYLQGLPQTLELSLEDKSLFVVHANPPSEQHGGIKLLNQQGEIRDDRKAEWAQNLRDFEHDVLIVGHTHQVYAEHVGDTFVVNPGSSVFNHSCMILKLPDMTVQTFALGDRQVTRCWNFGMLYR